MERRGKPQHANMPCKTCRPTERRKPTHGPSSTTVCKFKIFFQILRLIFQNKNLSLNLNLWNHAIIFYVSRHWPFVYIMFIFIMLPLFNCPFIFYVYYSSWFIICRTWKSISIYFIFASRMRYFITHNVNKAFIQISRDRLQYIFS